METSEDIKSEFEREWDKLTPAERRERIFLRPAFRDAYNEITQAHRQFPIPQYLWEKWLPVLGPLPIVLYMQLRRYCFFNPETGERRDICWPKQQTLANEIGVKDKATVRKALELLEAHGFIEREHTYYQATGSGHVRKGSDRYRVFFEIPLRAKDAVRVFMKRMADLSADDQTGSDLSLEAIGESIARRVKKSPYEKPAVDNSVRRVNLSPYVVDEKTTHRTNTLRNTSNVDNVGIEASEKQKLRSSPTLPTFPAAERERREMLIGEIGDSLKTWAGEWDKDPHRSEGFHRRVVYILPEVLVREALMATRDAIDRARGGGEGVWGGPAAYFAGVVKNIALREGLDLGLKAAGEPSRAGDTSA